ncbi:MAG: hypothetical protein SFX74_10290 [Fimbriimonadaceae bacterium]|nr:hypothetical protein [Fimbriimonadaceae bacterium]
MMLPSGLNDTVADEEKLARFVDGSNKKNASGANWRAFFPPLNGELSAARCGSFPAELERLAKLYLGHDETFGAAIFEAGSVRECGLDVTPSEPPEKHCNVSGWPSVQDLEEQKAMRKQKAMQLLAQVTDWIPFK